MEIMGILKHSNKMLKNSKERIDLNFITKTNYPYMYGESKHLKIIIRFENVDQALVEEFMEKVGYGMYHGKDHENGIREWHLGENK